MATATLNGHAPTKLPKAAAPAPAAPDRPLWVEIAPGKRVVKLTNDEKGRILISDLVPTGGGTYQAVARIHDRWVKMGRNDLAKIGITISRQTLRRLMLGGFIKYCQPAPKVFQFDLESYFAHERATGEDPEFWTRNRGENLRRYEDGFDSTGWTVGRKSSSSAAKGVSAVGTLPTKGSRL